MKVRKLPNYRKFKERGRFLFKEQWYSICSMHANHDDDCELCNTGTWKNIYMSVFSSFVFKHFPKFWVFWVNFNFFHKNRYNPWGRYDP